MDWIVSKPVHIRAKPGDVIFLVCQATGDRSDPRVSLQVTSHTHAPAIRERPDYGFGNSIRDEDAWQETAHGIWSYPNSGYTIRMAQPSMEWFVVSWRGQFLGEYRTLKEARARAFFHASMLTAYDTPL